MFFGKESWVSWRIAAVLSGMAWLCAVTTRAAPTQTPSSGRCRVVHVVPGFGFQTRAGCWNPMQVQIENVGAELRGVVVAQSPAGEHADVVSARREITVPSQARVHLFLPVFPTREPPEPRGAIEFAETWLSDGGAARWGGLSVMGTLARHDMPMVLVCDATNRSFNFVKKGFMAGREYEAMRAVIQPADFPARPAALAPVDVVILGSLGGYTLTGFQTDALRRWIEAGGVLVFVPGADFDPAQLGVLEALLPVQFGPPSRVHRLDFLAENDRLPVQSAEGFLLRPMTLREGRAIWGPPETPLAAERALGVGRILAFAADIGDAAFDACPDMGMLWSRLVILLSPARRLTARRLVEPAVLPHLVGELVGIAAPSRRVAAIYLGAVLTLILAPLILGHLLRRPVAGWMVSVGGALMVGVLAARAGRASGGVAAAQLVEVYQRRTGPVSTTAAVQSVAALYAPQGGTFTLHGADDAVLFDPLREIPSSTVEVRWTDRLEASALAVRPRAVRIMAAAGSVAHPRPNLTLRLDSEGLHVRVSHAGPVPLRDAFLRVRRLVVPLGDVLPGVERAAAAIRPSMPRREIVYTAHALRRARVLTQERLFAALYPPFRELAPLPVPTLIVGPEEPWQTPVFGYWTDQPSGLIGGIEPETPRQALGLTLIESPVTYEGDRLCWPRGTLLLHFPQRPLGVRSHPDGLYAGWQPAEFGLQFTLPEDAPALIPERIRVFRLFESDVYDCTVALEPPEGGSTVELPEGAVVDAPLTSPHPPTPLRAVRLRVRIRPRGGVADGMTLRPWLIRDLDIEWVGRVAPASAGEPYD